MKVESQFDYCPSTCFCVLGKALHLSYPRCHCDVEDGNNKSIVYDKKPVNFSEADIADEREKMLIISFYCRKYT